MKIKWCIVPLAALAMSLSACGGDAGSDDGGAEPATTASATASEDASDSSDDTASPDEEQTDESGASESGSDASGSESSASGDEGSSNGGKELSAGAQKAVEQFVSSHEGAEEMPASELDPSKAQEAMKNLKVEPKECADATAAGTMAEFMKDAAVGGASAVAPDGTSQQFLTLSELPDGVNVSELMAATRDHVTKCPSVSVVMGKQKVTTKMTVRDAKVQGADDALVMEMTNEAAGAGHTSYLGIAAKGNVVVSGAAASQDPKKDAAATEKILADAIGALG
ncbi:hypothetical protein [uncultured Tessaracoccus sp.]|uniref:hypothetical protein n=1 Tax=uncultured Tessaracoccus sp. TaxID=905023 RepID=UPI0025DD3BB5|nr:hypothetical protein [uncultured Tessaracoccus sp.]